MAEIIADHRDVGSGLQERRRTAVAEDMRRDLLLGKRRPLLGDCRYVFPQNVGDAIAGQRLAVAVDEDVLLVGAHRRAVQSMQGFGGLAPQWRQALLSALA